MATFYTVEVMDISSAPEPSVVVPWHRRRVRPRNVVLIFFAFALLLGYRFLSVPSGYLIEAPGPAISLAQKIANPTDANFAKSRIAYTTVQFVPLSQGDYLWRHYVLGQNNFTVTEQVSSQQSVADAYMMQEAKQTAQYLSAYLALGKKGTVTSSGSQIVSVLPNSPAAKASIQAGEVITKVNGHPANSPTALIKLINTEAANGSLTLTLTQPGQAGSISTPLKADLVRSGNKWTYRIGVTISPYGTFTPPAGVPSINTDGVSGPSGGMMFTLALIDAMTPGNLPGTLSIAGTGTIDAQGRTGPIGGVQFKVQAAAAAGAQVFFVDPWDYAAAKAAAPRSLHVIEARTILDPIKWLCENAPHDASHPRSSVCQELPTIAKRYADLQS